jgi:hypothetical protein
MGIGGEGFTTDEFSLEPETVDGLSIPAAAKLTEAACTGTVELGFMGAWAVGVGVELAPLPPSPQPPTIKPKTIISTPKGYMYVVGMFLSMIGSDWQTCGSPNSTFHRRWSILPLYHGQIDYTYVGG